MSTYYRLFNDTKRECVHLNNHIKYFALTQNKAVNFALCSYMMSNLGDTLRLCADSMEEGEGYKDVDLLTYKFNDPGTTVEIVELLNAVYEYDKYEVVDGVGVERA